MKRSDTPGHEKKRSRKSVKPCYGSRGWGFEFLRARHSSLFLPNNLDELAMVAGSRGRAV